MDNSKYQEEVFSVTTVECVSVETCEIDLAGRLEGVNRQQLPNLGRKCSTTTPERGPESLAGGEIVVNDVVHHVNTCISTQNDNNIDTSQTRETSPGRIKKKHRRGSKRKKPRKPRYRWKPYNKLTWEEKRKLDERDCIKAERKREEIKRKGRPIAPYNTTQFLMDEHDTIEPDLGDPDILVDASHSDFDDSTSEEEDFYAKDFTEAYETAHVETLHALSKNDLVNDYLELEHKVELMEKVARKKSTDLSYIKEHEDTFCKDINSKNENNLLVLETTRLKEENQKLRTENLELKKQLLIYQNKG